jgi:hypothetical protein
MDQTKTNQGTDPLIPRNQSNNPQPQRTRQTTTLMDQSTPTPTNQATNNPHDPVHNPNGLVNTDQWTTLPPRPATPTNQGKLVAPP